MTTDTIDGVLIDCDEDGFHLILSGEEAEYNFRLSGVEEELLRAVKREIGPWVQEMEQARAEYQEGRVIAIREDGSYRYEPDVDPEPYDLSDPKHPRHHEVMAEIADSRDER